MEEALEARAQVVQARLAVRCFGEAVLGAAAMASEADVAFTTVGREGFALVKPELLLLLREDQVDEVPLGDVAEQVARLDEVIAGLDVSVVLEGQRQAAGLAMNA